MVAEESAATEPAAPAPAPTFAPLERDAARSVSLRKASLRWRDQPVRRCQRQSNVHVEIKLSQPTLCERRPGQTRPGQARPFHSIPCPSSPIPLPSQLPLSHCGIVPMKRLHRSACLQLYLLLFFPRVSPRAHPPPPPFPCPLPPHLRVQRPALPRWSCPAFAGGRAPRPRTQMRAAPRPPPTPRRPPPTARPAPQQSARAV